MRLWRLFEFATDSPVYHRQDEAGGLWVERKFLTADDGSSVLEQPQAKRRHLIREHEKLGRTLTEEETLLGSLGFEISERSDEERRMPLRAEIPRFECNCEASARFTHNEPVVELNQLVGALSPFFL
jgi:hypothetical protein